MSLFNDKTLVEMVNDDLVSELKAAWHDFDDDKIFEYEELNLDVRFVLEFIYGARTIMTILTSVKYWVRLKCELVQFDLGHHRHHVHG